MAIEKLVLIKEADLTSNCPECFNQDLKLRFYQKHHFGKFVHKVTNEVTNKIVCSKCSSDIYPAKWTDDIERIFDYYSKTVTPERTSLKYTTFFYVLVLLFIALVAICIYFFIQGFI